jgi:hypothetical protein
MTVDEALAALFKIGLRGEYKFTDHSEWTRIFMIDPAGVTQGRLSFRNGELANEKFYVSKVANGSEIFDDEFWPAAWRLWVTKRELLELARWRMLVVQARHEAQEERAIKQAARDLLPPRKRPRLQINVRKYLYRSLFNQ